jgi:hypothetical protein
MEYTDYEIVICCSSVEQYEGVRAGISYCVGVE